MTTLSKLAIRFGPGDVNSKFESTYKMLFSLQKALDKNNERKTVFTETGLQNYTHVNYPRLKGLWDIAENVSKKKIEGAFVETGVWKGGCAAIMAYVSKKNGYRNPLYFFDSFEGLPEPSEEDGSDAIFFSKGKKGGSLKSIEKVKAGERFIREILFRKMDIDPKKVFIVKGWFQKTLPVYRKRIKKIAILRLDGDWYESTKVALDNLYDRVVKGGYVVIDDYNYWEGCKKAVDEFIEKRKLNVKLIKQDSSGVYFVKP